MLNALPYIITGNLHQWTKVVKERTMKSFTLVGGYKCTYIFCQSVFQTLKVDLNAIWWIWGFKKSLFNYKWYFNIQGDVITVVGRENIWNNGNQHTWMLQFQVHV